MSHDTRTIAFISTPGSTATDVARRLFEQPRDELLETLRVPAKLLRTHEMHELIQQKVDTHADLLRNGSFAEYEARTLAYSHGAARLARRPCQHCEGDGRDPLEEHLNLTCPFCEGNGKHPIFDPRIDELDA